MPFCLGVDGWKTVLDLWADDSFMLSRRVEEETGSASELSSLSIYPALVGLALDRLGVVGGAEDAVARKLPSV
jgi:hypothetical protein